MPLCCHVRRMKDLNEKNILFHTEVSLMQHHLDYKAYERHKHALMTWMSLHCY